jgi:hypothetical protein
MFIADGGGIFRGVLESSVFFALVGKSVGKNLGELFDGAVLGVAKGGKWGNRMWIFQCLNEVLNGLGSGIGRRESRHWNGGGKEFHCVGVAFAGGLGDEDSPAAVMVRSGTDVPAIGATRCPGSTDRGAFVNDDLCDGGCEWGPIAVKRSI